MKYVFFLMGSKCLSGCMAAVWQLMYTGNFEPIGIKFTLIFLISTQTLLSTNVAKPFKYLWYSEIQIPLKIIEKNQGVCFQVQKKRGS